MNRVYLFGKIVYKSKLKYVLVPKVKVYIELIIQVSSGDKFNCIVNEDVLEKIKDRISKANETSYVYIIGKGMLENNMVYIVVKDIYIFI